MMPAFAAPTPAALSTGQVAAALSRQGLRSRAGGHLESWVIRRLFERRLLPETAGRAGTYRLIPVAHLPAVADALLASGYARRVAGHAAEPAL